jgi:FlaA1/EpsC-like NDP-sugar epimerase
MRTIAGSRILITGGTGSFGNWMARKLAAENPRSVAIFSRDEKKQWDMRRDFPEFEYLVGDIRDYDRLLDAMRGIDLVFHAAALKQVPSCEAVPMEAVKTNILGAENIRRAAIARGVQLVIGLSTDKAVKPINAMGLSKAMMEKIFCLPRTADLGRSDSDHSEQAAIAVRGEAMDTLFCCVRYGNVMGSRGSVIPLFQKQAMSGEALTITHPEMTRFLLTLDDIVALVFHAIEEARGGEIFVKKAPAATVEMIALGVLFSLGLESERVLRTVGIRPGEKLHEILVNEYEIRRSVESDHFFTIGPERGDFKPSNGRPAGYEYTSANTRQIASVPEMASLLETKGKVESYV